jgi:hypothetical protein
MAETNGKTRSRKFFIVKLALGLGLASFIISLIAMVLRPDIAQQIVLLAGSFGTVLIVVGGGYIGVQGVADFRMQSLAPKSPYESGAKPPIMADDDTETTPAPPTQ